MIKHALISCKDGIYYRCGKCPWAKMTRNVFFLCVFVALVGACKVVEWPGYLLIEILF